MPNYIENFKVTALPTVCVPNAIYYVKAPGATTATIYVTSSTGVPTQAGSGGGGGGGSGTGSSLTLEAADIIVPGQPVRCNSLGKFQLANAAAVSTAMIAGLASVGAAIGFAATAVQSQLTLTDWTAVTGTTALTPGVPYFLSASTAGRLTQTPPTTPGQASAVVGYAANTTTIIIELLPPIGL